MPELKIGLIPGANIPTMAIFYSNFREEDLYLNNTQVYSRVFMGSPDQLRTQLFSIIMS